MCSQKVVKQKVVDQTSLEHSVSLKNTKWSFITHAYTGTQRSRTGCEKNEAFVEWRMHFCTFAYKLSELPQAPFKLFITPFAAGGSRIFHPRALLSDVHVRRGVGNSGSQHPPASLSSLEVQTHTYICSNLQVTWSLVTSSHFLL